MLNFSSRCRYFLFRQPTDMRKSFDGLSGLVRQDGQHQLLSGDVFIFINRRFNRIKLLMWQSTGFALYYKRLEQGTFEKKVFQNEAQTAELSWAELVLLLEGVELKNSKKRKRYCRKIP